MKNQLSLVQVQNNKPTTTSLLIAEKFGKRHDNIVRAIKKLDCSDGFSLLNYEERNYRKKGRDYPYYEITKDGFVFLAMGFRGKLAASFKEEYIRQFNRMAKKLSIAENRRQDPHWIENREQGKVTRKIETDSIQKFIEYAKGQGSTNANRYYTIITTTTYRALFIVKDQSNKKLRDVLDVMQLSFLQTCEYVAAKALSDGMEANLHYKDIFKLAKKRIMAYAETVGATKVISPPKPELIEATA